MSPVPSQRRTVFLTDIRSGAEELLDSDLLLFRGQSWVSRIIAWAGRGEASHAAKAVWYQDVPMVAEVRELRGGRLVTLASQVQRYPGLIDVYETNPDGKWPEYNRERATRMMVNFAGCDYGYWGVLAAAMRHLPLWRSKLAAAVEHRNAKAQPPFCSHACSLSDYMGGGVDPVPDLDDKLTEPADLARSHFYRYRYTIAGGVNAC